VIRTKVDQREVAFYTSVPPRRNPPKASQLAQGGKMLPPYFRGMLENLEEDDCGRRAERSITGPDNSISRTGCSPQTLIHHFPAASFVQMIAGSSSIRVNQLSLFANHENANSLCLKSDTSPVPLRVSLPQPKRSPEPPLGTGAWSGSFLVSYGFRQYRYFRDDGLNIALRRSSWAARPLAD
jgi:hypothetical protein